jgi:hypothetical protein
MHRNVEKVKEAREKKGGGINCSTFSTCSFLLTATAVFPAVKNASISGNFAVIGR